MTEHANDYSQVFDTALDLVSLHRLNGEPVIILGFTRHELTQVLLIALVVCLPLGLLVMSVIGRTMQGIPVGLLLALAVLIITGLTLSKIKRQRPMAYYQQRLALWCEDSRLHSTPFIRSARVWDNRRH